MTHSPKVSIVLHGGWVITREESFYGGYETEIVRKDMYGPQALLNRDDYCQ
jgi:hypothetical protein